MKTDTVQGASTPPIRPQEYGIQRQRARPMPGPVTHDGQAKSPMPPNLGYKPGSEGPGGAKVAATPANQHHTKACGYDAKVGM